LTFSFTRLDRLILGYHAVEAKASIALGELDTDDNSLLRTFQGRIVNLPVHQRNTFLSSVVNVMAALSVFIGFGLFTLFFLKILMSERLPSLSSILRRLK